MSRLPSSTLNFRRENHVYRSSIRADEALLIIRKWGTHKNSNYLTLAKDPLAYGVGLRIDLGRGFTKSAEACLSEIFKYSKDVLVLFPPVASGDVGIASEGEYYLSKEIVTMTRELAKNKHLSFGFLADPSACISFVMNNVFTIWSLVREKFQLKGVDIKGYGCSMRKSVASLSNLYWSYRAAGLLKNTNWREINTALNFEGREWVSDVSPTGVFAQPLDGIKQIYMSVSNDEKTKFLKSHVTHTKAKFHRKCVPSFDLIAYTDVDGWWILHSSGEEAKITTNELHELLSKSSHRTRIGLIIDPNDINWSSVEDQPLNDLKEGFLRRIPYPFTNYLAISSDVDWSNYSQLTLASDYLSLELGLPASFSAYPISRDSRWPSYDGILKGIQSNSSTHNPPSKLFHSLDCFHGIINSFDDLHLVKIGESFNDEEKIFSCFGYNITHYDGFVMTVNRLGFSSDHSPVIQMMENGNSGRRIGVSEIFHPQGQDIVLLYYEIFPGDDFNDGIVKAIRVLNPARLEVMELHTTSYIRNRISNLLKNLHQHHFTIPVFTGHGGGEGVWDFGALTTQHWLELHPEHARMALDLPGTPYYILDVLKSQGVFFYNPNDILSCNDFFDINELLKILNAQDTTKIYVFSRFFSQRFDELGHLPVFPYGKHGATVQGLPFTLNDILQRFHWAPSGQGCIIYTHLGHRVGNQISTRLGWNEELLSSLARLSEYVYARDVDEPVPFRIWFAPASAILTFSVVMKRLAKNITRHDDKITISSWRDEVLGESIPAPAVFGTSWLHGLTIYVDDPEQAEIVVDDFQITHFTRNYSEGLEPHSVTLVDTSRKRQVIAGEISPLSFIMNPRTSGLEIINDDSSNLIVIAPKIEHGLKEDQDYVWDISVPPVSLKNATHWTFELFLPDIDNNWSIGFQTLDLHWFDFGTFPDSVWITKASHHGSDWKRITLSFADSRSAFIPREAVIAIRVKLQYQKDADRIRFRDISIIYPTPTMKLSRNQRILSGLVTRLFDDTPVSGINVSCQFNNEIKNAVTDASGRYIYYDLPDAARCKIEVQSDRSEVRYMSGNVAYMSCDLWDWDIKIC